MTVFSVKPRVRTNVFEDMDKLFNEFFTDFPTVRKANGNATRWIPTNIVETNEGFRMEWALPGFEKSDVEIKVEEGVLRIAANKTVEKVEGEKVRRKEFGYTKFENSYRLGEDIDEGAIAANLENGVLTVNLPKKEEAKALPPRTIEIG